MTPLAFQRAFLDTRAAIQQVIAGMDGVIDGALTALFADGNALLVGLPGLGKTRLVRALSSALALESARIQFTPDLMPADITGAHLVEDGPEGRRFRLRRGPIFANLVLADEINRATPKTQAALLEAMQERQVTLLGQTHPVPSPFLVIATQNPVELEGTYPLPEAQLDRFLVQLRVGLPDESLLVQILDRTTGGAEPEVPATLDAERILEMRRLVREVPAAPETLRLAARLLHATWPDQDAAPDAVRRYVRYGASPRGAQSMVLAGKVRALIERGDRRQPVLSPEDLIAVAPACLRHRLILNFEGEADRIDPDDLILRAADAARRALR